MRMSITVTPHVSTIESRFATELPTVVTLLQRLEQTPNVQSQMLAILEAAEEVRVGLRNLGELDGLTFEDALRWQRERGVEVGVDWLEGAAAQRGARA